MKKLVIALAAFMLVFSCGVFEIVFSSATFSRAEELSFGAAKSIFVCVDFKQASERERAELGAVTEKTAFDAKISFVSAKERISELNGYWKERKSVAVFFLSQAAVKTLDDRFSALKAYGEAGQWEDAYAAALSLATYFSSLKDDCIPSLSDLF